MINWQGTVISQYNQSPTMQTLLYAINQWFDPRANLDDFYNLIWNVETAKGYGLDVWGRIVAVGRVLKVQATDPYFGFQEAGIVSAWPFNQGIFYSGEPLVGNYALSDDGFRVLIMAKAAFNIINGTIPAINQLLLNLFPGRGNAYVVDNRNMSMSYVFNFIPTPVEAAIIAQSGVLPRPTGVSVDYQFRPAGFQALIGGVGTVRATAS
jgi:uncharacterized protein DUF2612